MRIAACLLAAQTLGGLVACSGSVDDATPGSSAAGQSAAGSPALPGSGGSSTGGVAMTSEGGTVSTTGGTPSTGGVAETGGAAPTGGAAETGGASASGGSAAAGAPPSLADCPAAPAGSTPEAVIAMDTENTARLAMGLPCVELIPEISTAAQNHCDYYMQNLETDCEAPSAHNEIEGCPGFTGTGPGARMSAAGYESRGGSETMAFTGDPARAVTMFIDSVYHRTPILDPWTRHMGYGWGEECDTIDFGSGPETPDEVTAFYPYAGQIDVPTSFDGSREGPEPPEPSTGWPSGYPVTLYGRDLEVTAHGITLDGSADPLPHLWLAEEDQTLPSYSKVLYTEAPLEPNTAYRVVIDATRGGEALHFEWTFTTGMPTGGRPRP